MTILVGVALSCLIAFILSIPAIISELMRRTQNLPLFVDVHHWGKKDFTPGETFAIGLLIHLVQAMMFGGFYVWIQSFTAVTSRFESYSITSILSYTIVFWIVMGLIIFPVFRLGLFGRREGKFEWFEMLITYLLLAAGFYLALPLVT